MINGDIFSVDGCDLKQALGPVRPLRRGGILNSYKLLGYPGIVVSCCKEALSRYCGVFFSG